MITFAQNGTRFNYRVAGVCIEDDHILLWGAEGEDFWTLPGGRCEMGESSTEALLRELREELRLEVKIGRLLWVAENFFRFDDTDFHELGLIYEVSLPVAGHLQKGNTYRTTDGANEIKFEWFPLAELKSVRLVPSFLQDSLLQLPESPQRIEHRD
jgi:ADP-ribose pyrophosphatase YjhB (NUDIX family)